MQHLASSAFLRKKVLGFDGFDTVEGLDYMYIYLQSVVKAGFNSQEWRTVEIHQKRLLVIG